MIRNYDRLVVCTSSGRADKVIADSSDISRSVFSRPDTRIVRNGVELKKSTRLVEGECVEVYWTEEVFEGVKAEDIRLEVLYEDEDILVIDKAQGMVVHPGAGNYEGTVVNALVHRYGESFLKDEDDTRPGIVHRLDKDTSGVMIIAKNDKALENLSSQFASHTNEKYYLAICEGGFTESQGVVEKNIVRSERDRKTYQTTDNPEKGRYARTSYKVLERYRGSALLKIRIYTGRTHQIRVHMKSIGHPLVGDAIYNPKRCGFSLMLHACELHVRHPRTGEELVFVSPMPERFESYRRQFLP